MEQRDFEHTYALDLATDSLMLIEHIDIKMEDPPEVLEEQHPEDNVAVEEVVQPEVAVDIDKFVSRKDFLEMQAKMNSKLFDIKLMLREIHKHLMPESSTKLKFPLTEYNNEYEAVLISKLKKNMPETQMERTAVLKGLFKATVFNGFSKKSIKTSPVLPVIYAAWKSLYPDIESFHDQVVPVLFKIVDNYRRALKRKWKATVATQ